MMRWSFVLLPLFSIVLMSHRAQAQDANTVAADALFAEGRTLVEKGRFEEACNRFARSQALSPSVGRLLNLGECNEKLGRVATAWGAYAAARSLGAVRNDPRATLAAESAERLEPRLPHLAISIEKGDADVTITRDGIVIAKAALDFPVPVDPGPHEIVVSAPARRPWRATFSIAERETHALRVPALALLDATPEPAAAGDRTRRNAALGLGIGGAAVLAAGLALGALSFARWSSVTDTCPDGRCANDSDRDRIDRDASAARAFATASTIAVIVGGVGVIGGSVLYLTAPAGGMTVKPTSDGRGAGLLLTLAR